MRLLPKSRTRDEDDGCELSEERKFKLLKNPRRRLVIEHLLEEDRKTTRGELAQVIAAEENGVSPTEIRSNQRKTVYVSLYQTHLPALADADVVRYDANRGTVEPGPNIRGLVPYLRVSSESSGASWSPHLLALCLIAGGAFAAIRTISPGAIWVIDLWVLTFVSAVVAWSVLPGAERRPVPDRLTGRGPRIGRGVRSRLRRVREPAPEVETDERAFDDEAVSASPGTDASPESGGEPDQPKEKKNVQ
jgi:hypothetical protein